MRPWAEHLAAAGFSVELPRLPGHGTAWRTWRSPGGRTGTPRSTASFTALRERCDTVFVVGLSMGGSLALRLAENRADEVAGLVLVNPAVHSEDWKLVLLPVLKHVVKRFPGISNDIKKPGQDEGAYDKFPLKSFDSMHGAWSDDQGGHRQVTAPLLLLHSREDHVVEPSNAAWILANVASTDVTEVWLEDSYHVATIDNDAPLIFDASVEFVHRLAPQSAAG